MLSKHRSHGSRLSPRPLHLLVLEGRCLPSTYSIADLGVNFSPAVRAIPSFGDINGTNALNNNGAVIGTLTNSSGQAVPTLYENGTFTTLTGLTSVAGLNNNNEVSGGTSSGAVLWNNGVITPAALEGYLADNGTIEDGGEVDVNGTVTTLSPPVDNFSPPTLSRNGEYVGRRTIGGQGEDTASIWNVTTGQFTFTEPNFGSLGQTNGVNNSGQAVGQNNIDSGGLAFFYSNGQLFDLGQGVGSSANAINDQGTLVGTGSSGVFVESNFQATNLQSVLSGNSGFTLTNALAINDNGQILATATDSAGNNHTVLLNPVATTSLSIGGLPTTVTAGVANSFTVTVLNPNGTIATGYTGTVHFTSSDPQAVLPANYAFTAADAGVHTFSVTFKTANGRNNTNYTPIITVADIANPSISAGSQTEDAVNPGAATHFYVFSLPAGPPRTFNIVVEAMDSFGNVATGYTGTVHFSDSVRGQTLAANYTFTAGDAGYHASEGLKLTTRGIHRITVTDTRNNAIFGSVTIDVT